MNNRKKPIQIPGALHVFINQNTGKEYLEFLPRTFGESNDRVRWIKDLSCSNGGFWESKELRRESVIRRGKGLGTNGLLGRMKRLLIQDRSDAKDCGHAPSNISAQDLVQKWESQKGLCAACGLPLNLLQAHHDHNHETGESRGFLHAPCNFIEGFLRKMPMENRRKYLSWIKEAGL